jgi:hypothetical protein
MGRYLRPRNLIKLLLLALIFGPPGALAVIVENLYRADVEVEDHSVPALQRASREGLAQVLVKVSGGRGVLDNAQVKSALADNRRYLQRYQYLRVEDSGLNLQMHYDPQLVTTLLKEAGQPLWTANRPSLLVWLVVDDASGRRYASGDSHPQLIAELMAAFNRRGVPAVFPLYDLEDARDVSIHDLWQLDALTIYHASRRYDVATMLVGRMTALSDGRWMGDWLYLGDGERLASSFYGRDLPQLSASGVDFVADHLAQRYAVAAGQSQEADVLVRVDALLSYTDYRQVVEYFEGIELIETAYPTHVDGTSMIFRLRSQANAEQLRRLFALNGRLRIREANTAQTVGDGVELVYQWTP